MFNNKKDRLLEVYESDTDIQIPWNEFIQKLIQDLHQHEIKPITPIAPITAIYEPELYK